MRVSKEKWDLEHKQYHDELIQHGDILEFGVTVKKQSSVVCIGKSLFVESLTQDTKKKTAL